jgi:hypothetical protein
MDQVSGCFSVFTVSSLHILEVIKWNISSANFNVIKDGFGAAAPHQLFPSSFEVEMSFSAYFNCFDTSLKCFDL